MVNVAEDRNTPMEPSDEALCRRAADGSREAEEALVRRYSGLVRSCARPLFLAGGDSEDLIQEGMFGLIRAIREYDGAKAASFRTFAEVCIRNRLISGSSSALRAPDGRSHQRKFHLIIYNGRRLPHRLPGSRTFRPFSRNPLRHRQPSD